MQLRWTQLVVCVNIASQRTQRRDLPSERSDDYSKRSCGWNWLKPPCTLALKSAQPLSQMDKQYLIWLAETICGGSTLYKSWVDGYGRSEMAAVKRYTQNSNASGNSSSSMTFAQFHIVSPTNKSIVSN